MAIPMRVQDYLQQRQINYDVLRHPYSEGSEYTARVAGVPAARVVKAVLTEDHEGRHLLALIPADHHLSLYRLDSALQRRFHLVSESEVTALFLDCARGAVPALGNAYHLETVVDDALLQQEDLYLEAGDHEDLIHLSGKQFRALMRDAPHGDFSSNRELEYRIYS
ncbi:MAG: aminoacyl-tRNA deacylase [Pseudomonadota bacterium]